jgi:uncharacterized DUF497 family protein
MPLRFGVLVFLNPIRLERPAKTVHGELRYQAIGTVEGRVLSCIYTIDGSSKRLLSVRPASRNERRSHAAYVDTRGHC